MVKNRHFCNGKIYEGYQANEEEVLICIEKFGIASEIKSKSLDKFQYINRTSFCRDNRDYLKIDLVDSQLKVKKR